MLLIPRLSEPLAWFLGDVPLQAPTLHHALAYPMQLSLCPRAACSGALLVGTLKIASKIGTFFRIVARLENTCSVSLSSISAFHADGS